MMEELSQLIISYQLKKFKNKKTSFLKFFYIHATKVSGKQLIAPTQFKLSVNSEFVAT